MRTTHLNPAVAGIPARGVCLALAWLLVLSLLVITACATPSPSAATRLDGSASWLLMPVTSNEAVAGPDQQATESLIRVTENRLRSMGVQKLHRQSEGMRGVAQVSHRYLVSVAVTHWSMASRPDARSTLGVEISVHDRPQESVVWTHRARVTQRAGGSRLAALDKAVAAALQGMTIAASGTATPSGIVAPGQVAAAVSSTGDRDIDSVQAVEQALASTSAAELPVALATRTSNGESEHNRLGAPLSADLADQLDGRSTAFFYAANPPVDLLAQFDRVVLEPSGVLPAELAQITRSGARAYAYLSVGEVGPERPWLESMPAEAILGRNDVWNSAVMDLASPHWIESVLSRADALAEAGYGGLFLDTMDSFNIIARTPQIKARQTDALASLLTQLATRQPSLRLIANRGFEVLDTVAPHLEAVAAESLYQSWNNLEQRYTDVSASDREWLLGQLEQVRDKHGLDVIAIDYLPPAERARARAVATRIAQHGFIPWVGTPELDHVGVGAIDVEPRDVLMLFDSRSNSLQANAEVHRLLATPLEYLGYVPVYHDIAVQGLPPKKLAGRYRGIALWNRSADLSDELHDWLVRQSRAGIPLALFGVQGVPANSTLARVLGVEIEAALDANTAHVLHQDELIGFERPLPRRFDALGLQARSVAEKNTVHLRLGDDRGRTADLVVTGPWGGFAAHPGTIDLDVDRISYWVLEPFEFLKRALQLPLAPMPDVTTEQGKRLWLAHIDGDALPSWAELPGRRLGAEVIRDRILKRFELPHTISVVEAELTSMPQVADRRERMSRVMREIFRQPNVEIASHTFSHPFKWSKLATHRLPGRYNLRVADYIYTPEREVAGSAAFIDTTLAPDGKRTKVMLWSGDALPGEADLKAADDAGLENMNGGFTKITRAQPALSLVTPMARTVGDRLQVYAPVMNENVYTNDWTGPFDGFRRVIETFEMTDRPRRLKPINIYYHFYAGTKAATIRSLEEVYEWTVSRAIQPTTVSAYSARVRAFRHAGVARRLDGRWQLSSLGPIRSVRVLSQEGTYNKSTSSGVRTSHRLHDGLYLDIGAGDRVQLSLDDAATWHSATVSDALND